MHDKKPNTARVRCATILDPTACMLEFGHDGPCAPAVEPEQPTTDGTHLVTGGRSEDYDEMHRCMAEKRALRDTTTNLADLYAGPPHPGCDKCGRQPGPWFAPSAEWNLVIGGPEAQFDPGGMLCASCYVDLAAQAFPAACFELRVEVRHG